MKSKVILSLLMGSSKALQPQITSYTEWDEVAGLRDLAKNDQEFVELDSTLNANIEL